MKIKKKKPKTDQQKTEALRKRCVTKAKRLARERDNFKCRYCGCGEPQRQTHGSHVYSEGKHKSMSADTDNIICLCNIHHMSGKYIRASNDFNWHGAPAEAMDWFMEKYPELYKTLKERSWKNQKADFIFWTKKAEVLKEYERLIDKLKI